MGQSFSGKLTLLIFLLILTALGGSTFFFLRLYKNDKLNALMTSDLNNILRAAHYLENVINLSDLVEVDRIHYSQEIILLMDQPCHTFPIPPVVISELYKPFFRQFKNLPDTNYYREEISKLCKLPPRHVLEREISMVNHKSKWLFPTLSILIRSEKSSRAATISMEGFVGTESAALFIIDEKGKILWSLDGMDNLQQAFNDTHFTESELIDYFQKATGHGNYSTIEAGESGILSLAKLTSGWAIASLSYRPTVLSPVNFAMRQMGFLLCGFTCLCLFFGKSGAMKLIKPLENLRDHAIKLSQGNFKDRLSTTGMVDFNIVNSAFNSMTDRMVELIDSTHRQAELESELELARQVQTMLLPPSIVSVENHNISSFVKSANQCGGDWWGYFEVPLKNAKPILYLMIGDVTGHGAPSALVSACVSGAMFILKKNHIAQSETLFEPGELISQINRLVHEFGKSELGMTLFVAKIDPNHQKLYCANAGHNLPYLISQEGKSVAPVIVRAVGNPGPALGADRTVSREIVIEEHDWKQSSKLFLYTDGLIESERDGKYLFDRKVLRRTLETETKLTTSDYINFVLAEREKKLGSGPTQDDITLVLCEAA